MTARVSSKAYTRAVCGGLITVAVPLIVPTHRWGSTTTYAVPGISGQKRFDF